MRDAAVGFQCPDCVKSGARETRSGRTAYGGSRVADPTLTSRVLIGMNVLVWLLITVTGGAASRWVDILALRARELCFDGQSYATLPGATCRSGGYEWLPGVADGAPWQLLTSMFAHVTLLHIGFNMLALWVLGPQLEVVLGRLRFITLYLLSGLAGSALVYWLAPEYQPTLGASGAVFGLMAALLVLAVRVRGDVRSILMWVGLNAAITVVGRDFISWQGHLGGFLGGLALMTVFVLAPRGPRRAAWQAAFVAAYVVVLALALILRTLALA